MDVTTKTALLVFAASMVGGPPCLGGQVRERASGQPGILATFLRENKAATIDRKSLAALEGADGAKAAFTVIVASDRARPDMKAGGLEVRLEQAMRKETVYLDDDRDEQSEADSLKMFQGDLAHFADKERTLQYWRTHEPEATERDTTVGACNRSSISAYFPRETVLNAGWHKDGNHAGLTIAGALGYYYFPDVDVSRLVDIIAAARAFLEATRHSPPPDPVVGGPAR